NPSDNQGFVSLQWIAKDADLYESTLNRIEELVNHLTSVTGYRKRDIVVLAEKNSQGSRIARHLTEKGISVISSESLLLKASPEVNLLVSMLRWLADPYEEINSIAVCNFMIALGKISGQRQEVFRQCKQPGLLQVLENSGFTISPFRLQSYPVYDLAEELIRIFALGEKHNPYVQFFLDFINKLVSVNTVQLADVLEAWDEKSGSLSVVVPDGADAVRVMTIHKAKGLEFPVVIYSFAVSDKKNGKDKLWINLNEPELAGLPAALVSTGSSLESAGYGEAYHEEKEKTLLDKINMMYVAMTRPIDRLYVITREASSGDEGNSVEGLIMKFVAAESGDKTPGASGLMFGEDTVLEKSALQNAEIQTDDIGWISESWNDRIRISLKAPRIGDNSSNTNHNWGNIVHQAMAAIHAATDIDPVTTKMVSEGVLPREKEPELKQRLTAVLSHPKLAACFEEHANIKTEAEIILPGGKVLRPDRVVITDNEVVVIDYKTGKPMPDHEAQLSQYAEVLREMGYANVRKLLVYIDEETEVKEV
ncbi:MAG TPA: 3'-5' exonuclease, partial [Bacteroidales bacterium]|nr:3'-5' exonuclease [Bacteroidales bacterium]